MHHLITSQITAVANLLWKWSQALTFSKRRRSSSKFRPFPICLNRQTRVHSNCIKTTCLLRGQAGWEATSLISSKLCPFSRYSRRKKLDNYNRQTSNCVNPWNHTGQQRSQIASRTLFTRLPTNRIDRLTCNSRARGRQRSSTNLATWLTSKSLLHLC